MQNNLRNYAKIFASLQFLHGRSCLKIFIDVKRAKINLAPTRGYYLYKFYTCEYISVGAGFIPAHPSKLYHSTNIFSKQAVLIC